MKGTSEKGGLLVAGNTSVCPHHRLLQLGEGKTLLPRIGYLARYQPGKNTSTVTNGDIPLRLPILGRVIGETVVEVVTVKLVGHGCLMVKLVGHSSPLGKEGVADTNPVNEYLIKLTPKSLPMKPYPGGGSGALGVLPSPISRVWPIGLLTRRSPTFPFIILGLLTLARAWNSDEGPDTG